MKSLNQKVLIIIALAGITSVTSAMAEIAGPGTRLSYYCTEGNPFTDGMSKRNAVNVYSDNSVTGALNGKAFSFEKGKSTFNSRTGIATFSDKTSAKKVEIQVPGPYDGGQDTLWGKISNGSEAKVLNCYIGG